MSKSFLYIVIACVIPLGFWAAASLKFETDITAYNLASDEEIAAYEAFIDNLAPRESEETVIVLEKESGWHTLEDFQLLEKITASWQAEKELENVSCLANLRYPKKGILLPSSVPFLDLKQPQHFQQRMEHLEDYADIVDKFLSKDKRYTLVFARVPQGITKDLATRLSTTATQKTDLEIHYVQYDLMQEELQSVLRKDTVLLASISLCLILIGFYFFTRSLLGLGLIGLMIAFNIALTFLVIYVLSIQFTIHMITIPCVITVLSFTDIMHILYHQQMEHASAETDMDLRRKILTAVRIPLLLTSLTNIVGFFLFLALAENVHLFHFSLIAIVGVGIAYLSSRFIVIRLMDKDIVYIKSSSFGLLYRIHNKISVWFWQRQKAILALFLAATVGLITLVSTSFSIDSSEQEYVLSSSPLSKGQTILQEEFFGGKQAEIFVSLNNGTIWDKATLDQLEEVETNIQQLFQPLYINSPLTLVKRYHRYLSNGHPAAFQVPHKLTDNYVAQLIKHQDQLGGNGIIDTTATQARIVFGFGFMKLSEARKAYEQLRTVLADENTTNIHFELTGLQYLSDEATHTFSLKILLGLLISILFGSVLVYLLLRSIRKSIGVLLVNLFPMFFALSILLYWQLAITPLTLFLLSILLGICVDDSIYLVTQHRKDSNSFYVVPIFITSFVLSLGFLSLACASFAWIQPFGWIFLLGIWLAYILDFFVLPLFLRNTK